jgi:uncharacterized protein YlxP (DUF503 family)
MKRELEQILKTLNTYEKQELVISLLTEIQMNHNIMVNNLNNIDGYIFGMITNAENNKLNELTLKQLDSIKNILDQSPIQGERDER